MVDPAVPERFGLLEERYGPLLPAQQFPALRPETTVEVLLNPPFQVAGTGIPRIHSGKLNQPSPPSAEGDASTGGRRDGRSRTGLPRTPRSGRSPPSCRGPKECSEMDRGMIWIDSRRRRVRRRRLPRWRYVSQLPVSSLHAPDGVSNGLSRSPKRPGIYPLCYTGLKPCSSLRMVEEMFSMAP